MAIPAGQQFLKIMTPDDFKKAVGLIAEQKISENKQAAKQAPPDSYMGNLGKCAAAGGKGGFRAGAVTGGIALAVPISARLIPLITKSCEFLGGTTGKILGVVASLAAGILGGTALGTVAGATSGTVVGATKGSTQTARTVGGFTAGVANTVAGITASMPGSLERIGNFTSDLKFSKPVICLPEILPEVIEGMKSRLLGTGIDISSLSGASIINPLYVIDTVGGTLGALSAGHESKKEA